MSITSDPARRTAAAPDRVHTGPVTLINCFVVAEGQEEAFEKLWSRTSRYFRAQPGFISLRLHRALSAGSSFRFINVAEWASAAQFAQAHAAAEFKALVSQPQWQEFPSSPALYEVTTRYRATPVASSDVGSVPAADASSAAEPEQTSPRHDAVITSHQSGVLP